MSVERQLLMASGGVTQYTIQKSLRFRSSASAYLSRTIGAATNANIITVSLWVKRGSLSGTRQTLLTGVNSAVGTAYWFLEFDVNNCLNVQNSNAAGVLTTTQVFRDPSSWYHIVVAVDTTQATASNRTKIYVNGSQVTSFSTTNYPTQNSAVLINQSGYYGDIGSLQPATGNYFDGYLAEINFIDGQALTPSSFGETSSTTGVWIPKQYSGSYGTNGFYLKFTDTTSTTALGYDSSGNGNNWTPNNLSLTTGSTYDSMLDSPTNYDNGGNGVGNYAVLNPLDNGGLTVASANLNSSDAGGSWKSIRSTIGIVSGKWYWEVTATSGVNLACGISRATAAQTANSYVGVDANGWGYIGSNGQKYTSGSGSAYGATYTNGDVVGIAFDADAGTLTFYKNNASQGVAFTGLTSGPYFPAVSNYSSGWAANFGQRPFAYTPPTGYKALNTQNLPAPSIVNGASYMAATTYTGTGASLSVSGAAFQPDLVWIKSRSAATDHALYDVIRGTQNRLESNTTDAAVAADNGLTAFNSNGFTVNTLAQVNTNAATYIGWQWKAGGTAVTNTAGSITSSVSANTTSGFSVVTFTCNAGGSGTFGHGLGIAPSMVIIKSRNLVGAWPVGHTSIPWTNYLLLNTTASSTASSTVWNNTAPSSTVVTLGSGFTTANYDSCVAYCFAAIPGYSAFGSYTGNGSSDGPFVYCGFRPRWVMFKCTSASGTSSNWIIQDTSRDTYNAMPDILIPNLANAELTDPATTGFIIDCLSNGFKIRTSNQNWNISGGTYIYAAFAENPFQNARAR